MKNEHSNIFIVIRRNQERTFGLCSFLSSCQIENNQIVSICEKPFFNAVKKTFEIGLDSTKCYLLGMDADVLLFPDALEYMIYETQNYGAGKDWFRIDFSVYDKFRGRVTAGAHLYNNKYSGNFYNFLNTSGRGDVLRPEYDNVKAFCESRKLEYRHIPHYIVGKHDYFQYYRDIYRKYHLREKRSHLDKNTDLVLKNLRQMRISFLDDYDYAVALKAFEESYEGIPPCEDVCAALGIQEKQPIPEKDFSLIQQSLASSRIMQKIEK